MRKEFSINKEIKQIIKMSSKDIADMSAQEKNTLAYAFATLLCVDAKVDIKTENYESILKSAGMKADAALSKLYSKALDGKDVSKWFQGGGGGGSSAPAQTSAPATS